MESNGLIERDLFLVIPKNTVPDDVNVLPDKFVLSAKSCWWVHFSQSSFCRWRALRANETLHCARVSNTYTSTIRLILPLAATNSLEQIRRLHYSWLEVAKPFWCSIRRHKNIENPIGAGRFLCERQLKEKKIFDIDFIQLAFNLADRLSKQMKRAKLQAVLTTGKYNLEVDQWTVRDTFNDGLLTSWSFFI